MIVEVVVHGVRVVALLWSEKGSSVNSLTRLSKTRKLRRLQHFLAFSSRIFSVECREASFVPVTVSGSGRRSRIIKRLCQS
jgi:hypothetical protein